MGAVSIASPSTHRLAHRFDPSTLILLVRRFFCNHFYLHCVLTGMSILLLLSIIYVLIAIVLYAAFRQLISQADYYARLIRYTDDSQATIRQALDVPGGMSPAVRIMLRNLLPHDQRK